MDLITDLPESNSFDSILVIVDHGLTKGQNDGQQLLRSLVEFAIGLQVEVDVNEMGAAQELEHHARRDDGCYSQLHQSSSITRQHHSQPV